MNARSTASLKICISLATECLWMKQIIMLMEQSGLIIWKQKGVIFGKWHKAEDFSISLFQPFILLFPCVSFSYLSSLVGNSDLVLNWQSQTFKRKNRSKTMWLTGTKRQVTVGKQTMKNWKILWFAQHMHL